MTKITVIIECSIKELEMANFLLSRAFESSKENEAFQRLWQISPAELNKGEDFRLKLVEQYLKHYTR